MGIWKTEWGWRAEVMVKGRRYRANGFFQHKAKAREWVKEEKARRKALAQSTTSADDDLLLWELAQDYLAQAELSFSRKTLDEKRYCLKRFYEAFGNVDVREIKAPNVADFIRARAQGASKNAANKDRKNLKAFYSWVLSMYGIMHDPTAPIRKLPHQRKARRLIPLGDILKVLAVAKGSDGVLIGAYWYTGARKGEVLRWRWDEDINFEERWVRLGTCKSKGSEMVYGQLWMNDDLYALLKWQRDNRNQSSPYVFCHATDLYGCAGKPFVSKRNFVKNLCKAAGVEPFNFHDIRHTVAKYLNGMHRLGTKKIGQVLRHQRQGTTEIYVGTEALYTDTREAMDLLSRANLMKAAPDYAEFTQNENEGLASCS